LSKLRALLALLAIVGTSFVGCSSPAATRNVILFVGDGLGPAQTAYGSSYARDVEGRRLNIDRLMELGNTGYVFLQTYDSVVMDSAASASQMATGITARSETLAVEPEGYRLQTILEWAEERGLSTGLVTTTRLTHATPAAFATHQISRYVDEQDIANDMISEPEIEVLLGGGARAFVPRGKRVSEVLAGIPPVLDGDSRRKDDRNLVEEAEANGYTVARDRESLDKAVAHPEKVLGLFSASHLPYVLDRTNENLSGVPSLDEMTEAALAILGTNEEGFFLLVEGGRIDHAGHDNDAGTMLHEILEFDEAVGVGMRYQSLHPETLIVVTADHATGGFSFTYSLRPEPWEITLANGETYNSRWNYPGKKELEILGRQKMSFERILGRVDSDPDRLIEEVERATGLRMTREEAEQVLLRNDEGHAETRDFREFYVDYDSSPMCLLGRALARHTSVVWSTGGHTSDPVFAFGAGPGAEKLCGMYPNTHLFHVMKEALGGTK
jgi:alkaline phosphatase